MHLGEGDDPAQASSSGAPPNPHGAFELKVVSTSGYSPESQLVTAPTMAAWPSPMNEGQTRTARLRTRASKEGDHRIPERAPGCTRAASPCPCPSPPILSHRTFRAARALRLSDPAPFTSKSRVGDGRSGAPIRKADGWMYVDVRRPELMMFYVSRTIGYQCKLHLRRSGHIVITFDNRNPDRARCADNDSEPDIPGTRGSLNAWKRGRPGVRKPRKTWEGNPKAKAKAKARSVPVALVSSNPNPSLQSQASRLEARAREAPTRSRDL